MNTVTPNMMENMTLTKTGTTNKCVKYYNVLTILDLVNSQYYDIHSKHEHKWRVLYIIVVVTILERTKPTTSH
jgi:hypothetical protein